MTGSLFTDMSIVIFAIIFVATTAEVLYQHFRKDKPMKGREKTSERIWKKAA